MKTITVTSLSGGQGKTTVTFLLGLILANQGRKVLIGDADPQSNLTFYTGHIVDSDAPTFLELITGVVEPIHTIYSTRWSNLCIIPSDGALSKAQDYLSNSGFGAAVLKNRLSSISHLFDYLILDSPPQRSQICMTCIGAATALLTPVEASTKGINSLVRTLELQQELKTIGAFTGQYLGIIPFRDRWFGRSQSTDSKEAISIIKDIAGDITVFASILESQQYKKATRLGLLPRELGFADLEQSFNQIVEKLCPTLVTMQ